MRLARVSAGTFALPTGTPATGDATLHKAAQQSVPQVMMVFASAHADGIYVLQA